VRWLVRLVTPEGGCVLDPFAGSGTTAVAALKEGHRCIIVEREAAYCEIIRRRVAEALGVGKGSLLAPEQPDLFAESESVQ
jgi:DNA modification methylase